jgi:hypothetical protein
MTRVANRLRVAVAVGCASLPGVAVAQTYSDADLLSRGRAAWDSDQCVTASKYFFAYLDRTSGQGRSTGQPGKALEEAIQWCEHNTILYGGTKGDDPNERIGQKPVKPGITPGVVVQPPIVNDPIKRRARAYAILAVAQN